MKRGAEFDSAALQVGKQGSLGSVEWALAFRPGAEPAEPIELAAVGEAKEVIVGGGNKEMLDEIIFTRLAA